MKKIIFIILDKFANWELAYLSAALAQKIKANGKVLGAICDSARFCAVDGLLNDVKHTTYSYLEDTLELCYIN